MNITQFKKMLAMHGADFGRWDADADAGRAFMKTSKEAQALYKEAETLDRALNSFAAGAADPALLDKVMNRIDGSRPDVTATVHRLEPRRKAQPFVPVFWGGAAALAASVVLFVAFSGDPVPVTPERGAVVASAAGAAEEPVEVDTLLAEIDKLAEEEIAAQEIIAMLDTAQASSAPPAAPLSDDEVEAFLNQLFPLDSDNPEPEPEMDAEELFPENETREL